MGFFDKLFGKKSNKIDLTDNELIEAGACPNCWGVQDYEGAFVQYTEDQTKSNISGDKSHQKAFVQQFIETSVTGIRLKKDGNQMVCPKCNRKHKFVNTKAV